MQVYFIAHGNAKIGMGHIMRTLSLAEAFRECAHEVSFFSRYEQGSDIITGKGFHVDRILVANAGDSAEKPGFFYGGQEDLEDEITYLSDSFSQRVDLLVVDSYNVTPSYFRKLRKFTKRLMYIDDLNAFFYPVDVLVNGTASACDMGYEEKQKCRLLLGLRYNLMRREFRNMPSRQTKRCITDILVTTGNSDPYHITEKILKAVLREHRFRNYNYHVIIGGGFQPDIWKDEELRGNRKVFLYHMPSNIVEIMLKCDLAITAGGSTLYELAACGVPMIVFSYADNQMPQINALEKVEMLKSIGRYDAIDEKKIFEYVSFYVDHYEDRKRLAPQLQSMVDGEGAYRIVKEVE